MPKLVPKYEGEDESYEYGDGHGSHDGTPWHVIVLIDQPDTVICVAACHAVQDAGCFKCCFSYASPTPCTMSYP